MKTVEILKAARALIAEPEKWTKGTFATNEHAQPVDEIEDASATCFCAVGAIRHASGDIFSDAESILAKAIRAHPSATWRIYDFNDHATHADVLAAFDRAISLAEKEQP